ncbi:hypothetical protein [Mesorhizobium sp. M0058]|uniref:hypothetical protein n=1 Tax=Mesorhizobium sp. M0058 TaxID=2956865 RepID=UPI0033391BDA
MQRDIRPVAVTFPDGVRSVPAHSEPLQPFSYSTGPLPPIQRLVPVDMPGWLFSQIITGEWIAIKTLVDADA